jgi:hypothetical protein
MMYGVAASGKRSREKNHFGQLVIATGGGVRYSICRNA